MFVYYLPTKHYSIRCISLDMCRNVYRCKGLPWINIGLFPVIFGQFPAIFGHLGHFNLIWILLSSHFGSILALFGSFGMNGLNLAQVYSQWTYTSHIGLAIVMSRNKGYELSQAVSQSGSKGLKIDNFTLTRRRMT